MAKGNKKKTEPKKDSGFLLGMDKKAFLDGQGTDTGRDENRQESRKAHSRQYGKKTQQADQRNDTIQPLDQAGQERQEQAKTSSQPEQHPQPQEFETKTAPSPSSPGDLAQPFAPTKTAEQSDRIANEDFFRKQATDLSLQGKGTGEQPSQRASSVAARKKMHEKSAELGANEFLRKTEQKNDDGNAPKGDKNQAKRKNQARRRNQTQAAWQGANDQPKLDGSDLATRTEGNKESELAGTDGGERGAERKEEKKPLFTKESYQEFHREPPDLGARKKKRKARKQQRKATNPKDDTQSQGDGKGEEEKNPAKEFSKDSFLRDASAEDSSGSFRDGKEQGKPNKKGKKAKPSKKSASSNGEKNPSNKKGEGGNAPSQTGLAKKGGKKSSQSEQSGHGKGKKDTNDPVRLAARATFLEAGQLATKEAKKGEEEDDNNAVEAARIAGQSAGRMASSVSRHIGNPKQKGAKAFHAEDADVRAEFSSNKKKRDAKSPKKSQKRRTKREYAKALIQKDGTGNVAGYARKATGTDGKTKKKKHWKPRRFGVMVAVATFVIVLLSSILSVAISLGTSLLGGVSEVLAGSYQSEPTELDESEEILLELELGLQDEIDGIESAYPGYDEYRYNLGELGHDPFDLADYLSAKYGEVDSDEAREEIESLFAEMYELTVTPTTETRTRTVTKTGTRVVTDPVTGEEKLETYEYQEEEEYTAHILDVTLHRKPLDEIAKERLMGDSDAMALYEAYQDTKGALQDFYSPLDLDWYGLVKSYYGERKDDATGEFEFHEGIDIAVAEGTDVHAAQDGTVTAVYEDDELGLVIVIENEEGYSSVYGCLASALVSTGQTVSHGDLIGKTGHASDSTGSQLHLEVLFEGEHYNPLYYVLTGDGSPYGSDGTLGNSGGSGDGSFGGDIEGLTGDVAGLFAEAEKYLGYPYVWGGSSPSTSFDCSGFVCYVLTHSGYFDMPRTTAQGIYNQTTKVDASGVKPGDLIFFTGTYKTSNPVTHVGIYAGNGMMIHCGDPIQYTSINTSYWQKHFYAFGRLR